MNWLNRNDILRRAQSEQAALLMEKMVSQTKWYKEHFRDSASIVSGWGHHYFCDEDGSFLIFDKEQPHIHKCPQCGRLLADQRYDAAWVYMYRYDAIMTVYESACLYYITHDDRYLECMKHILGFYTENYQSFEPHGEASGLGKITPQVLDEAVLMVRIMCALLIVGEELPSSFTEKVKTQLLLPAAEFILEQERRIHNISCWMNACLVGVGLMTGSKRLVDEALYGEFGLEAQVNKGVTKDGFWYEGSLHYDYFTIEALLNTLMFCQRYEVNVDPEIRNKVYGMLIAPCKIAFSNTSLPNPNDGWPGIGLKTYAYLYDLGSMLFDSDELYGICETIHSADVPYARLPLGGPVTEGTRSIEWLMYSRTGNTDNKWKFKSQNDEDTCFALLRNDTVECFVKYGFNSPSHAHPDIMNVELHACGKNISSDLSNCGYATPLCSSYYRQTVSHNTVMVDGKSQNSFVKGKCCSWVENSEIVVKAGPLTAGSRDSKVSVINTEGADTVESSDSKEQTVCSEEGVKFTRKITIENKNWRDMFSVSAHAQHSYDWFFHVKGELLQESLIGYEQEKINSPYIGITDCTELHPENDVVLLAWNFGSVTARQKIILQNGNKLILGKSFGMPASDMNHVLWIHSENMNAVFEQEWTFEENGR